MTVDNSAPLCNLCGHSCWLGPPTEHQKTGGLIDAKVCGDYESTPGNGYGALDDTERYRFSLCEFCLDWLFSKFQIPVTVDYYMDDFCPQEGESIEEASVRNDGFVKLRRSSEPPPVWKPAAERVAMDDWRKMKKEFAEEAEKRARARNKEKP